MSNSTDFIDAEGICSFPVVVRCVGSEGLVEVDSHCPCPVTPAHGCRTALFHRYCGKEFINEAGEVLPIAEIHSRANKWNKAARAANGGTGEAAGFNTPV